MKALIVIAILFTLALIVYRFRRNGESKKLLISLGAFALLLTLSSLGAMVRSVVPLFIAHFILVVISWGALLLYITRGKLYWYLIISPIVTIVFFLVMERLIGSGGY